MVRRSVYGNVARISASVTRLSGELSPTPVYVKKSRDWRRKRSAAPPPAMREARRARNRNTAR